MPPDFRPTKAQRIHYRFMADAMNQLEWDLRHPIELRRGLPREWHDICEAPSKTRHKITLRLDADVVKFFKAIGPGYQQVMNRVLNSFMHARLARMVDGPESYDYIAQGVEDDAEGFARPKIGEWETEMQTMQTRAWQRDNPDAADKADAKD